MKIAQLYDRNVVTVRAGDGIVAAARLMREHHIGFVVVVEPDFASTTSRPIGVLTDRDIVVAVVARDRDARATTVAEIMTPNPVVVTKGESLSAVLREMRRVGVRRLPVVGDLGELVGVLSLDAALDALAGELSDLAGAVRNERRFETGLRT